MQEVQNLYMELNRADKRDAVGDNIASFKQRLEIFVYRKVETY